MTRLSSRSAPSGRKTAGSSTHLKGNQRTQSALPCHPVALFSPLRSSRRAGSNAPNPVRPGRVGEYSAAERFSHTFTRPPRAVFQGSCGLAKQHGLSKYVHSHLDRTLRSRLFCNLAQCPCGRDHCARTAGVRSVARRRIAYLVDLHARFKITRYWRCENEAGQG